MNLTYLPQQHVCSPPIARLLANDVHTQGAIFKHVIVSCKHLSMLLVVSRHPHQAWQKLFLRGNVLGWFRRQFLLGCACCYLKGVVRSVQGPCAARFSGTFILFDCRVEHAAQLQLFGAPVCSKWLDIPCVSTSANFSRDV